MRKVMIVLMVCLLAVASGCGGFGQVQQAVEQSVCNPPENVVALAVAADPFIQMALIAGLPEALPAYQAVLAILSNGMACATVQQVNALIALLSGNAAKTFQLKEMKPQFDVQPLKDWLAKEKK